MYLGHDAEFAVLDKNGKAVSAHAFFPPKEEPVYTGYQTSKGVHQDCYFRDGTSLEVNTPGWMTCIGNVLNSTANTLQQATQRLPAGYSLEALSAYEIEEDLSEAPPDVVNSGCHPVKNAYEGWDDRPAYQDRFSKERFAGGHIHMSDYQMDAFLKDEKVAPEFCSYLVRNLDLLLAVPILFTGLEGKNGKKRRQIYGKAGEYRYQKYKGGNVGVEYRVLGPEWLREQGIAGYTLIQARNVAYNTVDNWYAKKKLDEPMIKAAREQINEGNTDEVFLTKAFQKVFDACGLRAIPRQRAYKEHFEFIRENNKKDVFTRMSIHKQGSIRSVAGDLHKSWPERLPEWGFTKKHPCEVPVEQGGTMVVAKW